MILGKEKRVFYNNFETEKKLKLSSLDLLI